MIMECGICLDEAEVPHAIEKHRENCSYIYCYLCISRHLRCRDTCPSCGHKPITRFDIYFVGQDYKTESQGNAQSDKLINKQAETLVDSLSYSMARKEENVKKILKKYRIRLDGSKTMLENRFYELVDLVYMQKYRDKALSDIEIAWRINRQVGRKVKRKVDEETIKNLLELKNKIKQNKKI